DSTATYSFVLDPSAPQFSPLSLHDALPIFRPLAAYLPVDRPDLGRVHGHKKRPTATHTTRRGADLGVSAANRPGLVSALDRVWLDRKSTRLNSSHVKISYAVFCLKNKMRVRRLRHCGPAASAPPARPVVPAARRCSSRRRPAPVTHLTRRLPPALPGNLALPGAAR